MDIIFVTNYLTYLIIIYQIIAYCSFYGYAGLIGKIVANCFPLYTLEFAGRES